MSKHDTATHAARPALDADTAERANPWRGLRGPAQFFENDEIATLVQRGLFYARAGLPIHFQGAAGRGKTAIAMQIATRLGRPVSVMTGHNWLSSKDLIGREVGHTTNTMVDKYVQRVKRSEVSVRHDWDHSLLAEAMLHGHTLVYDEFTRANAESNGILLSVLEEGVLISTDRLAERPEIHAHADFRIILTSNPSDYAGVNTAPDALLDRMVTFSLNSYALATEAGIVAARTGVPNDLAADIVALVDKLHQKSKTTAPRSMRAAILIARIAAARLHDGALSDALLAQIAADVLASRGVETGVAGIASHLGKAASAKDPK